MQFKTHFTTLLAKKYKRTEGNSEAPNYLQSKRFFLQLFHIGIQTAEPNFGDEPNKSNVNTFLRPLKIGFETFYDILR